MDYDELAALRRSHPAWRLLLASHAPLVASFLHEAFIAPNVRTLAQSALRSKLEDVLFHLREAEGPEAFPRGSDQYLDEWADEQHGWLRKYYPADSDEPHFDVTPGAERAIEWLAALGRRSFVATESRIMTVFELLRQIVEGTTLDPASRVVELERRRRELDDEITLISKPARGHGYELVWSEVNHRQLGRNRVPSGAIVPTEDDALALARRAGEAARFRVLYTATTVRFPVLAPWLLEEPLRALEQAADWDRVLAALEWFCAHPRPGVYLRQIDAEGVHTKFIEERKGLFAELLDRVLPPEAVDAAAGTGSLAFEARYGLRTKPALVRLRLLDRRHLVAGLSDLTLPAAELATLRPAVERVFITENEINGLAFPDAPDSLVIFGLGFGLGRLAQVPWLGDVAVHYWGDIDTHGFAILDRLRAALPHARSFLMDRATLLAHRPLWGQERDNERHLKPLARLGPDEAALYDDLVANRLADRLRLEQERISFSWLQRALVPDDR